MRITGVTERITKVNCHEYLQEQDKYKFRFMHRKYGLMKSTMRFRLF